MQVQHFGLIPRVASSIISACPSLQSYCFGRLDDLLCFSEQALPVPVVSFFSVTCVSSMEDRSLREGEREKNGVLWDSYCLGYQDLSSLAMLSPFPNVLDI